MPTYDYVCDACGHAFEHFQSMSSKRLRKCPECGERKLDRLVGSGAGVIFKGSGFYETDYKRSSTPPPSESPSSDTSSKSESSDAKAKPSKDD
ncbi:MAG: zinc ribbon domain-containing protein [Planctomycetota bacterium]|nr:zinc ribbon domain-containing protein [Planctomycetota bacterium]